VHSTHGLDAHFAVQVMRKSMDVVMRSNWLVARIERYIIAGYDI
jgi:hypothetical protein